MNTLKMFQKQLTKVILQIGACKGRQQDLEKSIESEKGKRYLL